MKVFWSWQNDYEPKTNRKFIRAALGEAVNRVGDELGLEAAERPELDHDTKSTPGMAEITGTILGKISESAVFVADLTPIGVSPGGKALPNPNVLIELGWALKCVGADRIIAIMNTATGYGPEALPFDIRHRRAMPYALAPDASPADRKKIRKQLTDELVEALRINLGEYAAAEAEAAEFKAAQAKSGDRSVWHTLGNEVEFVDTADITRKLTVPGGPRAYIRIIPSGWRCGTPSVFEIQRAKDADQVGPVTEGSNRGDFGPCEEGFARVWHTGDDEAANISMWFDDTGEFWVLHGTAVGDWKDGKKVLRVGPVLRGWHDNLRSAMKVFDRHGAYPARRVEAGVVGIKGTMWPSEMVSYSKAARKPESFLSRPQRDWGEGAQLEFLTDVYNKIRDNFGLPHADQNDLGKMVGRQ